MNERPLENALTLDESESVLGIHVFSLLSRIQAGEIKSARARSGEMLIPGEEMERLAGAGALISAPVASSQRLAAKLTDERLGIKRTCGALRRDGESLSYKVPGHVGRFTATGIKSYRAAFGEIAEAVEFLTRLKKQLSEPSQRPASSETEICTPQIGRWQVRSTLPNLGPSEILLCERENDFAVIERFRGDLPYARANGNAEVLLQGNDARQLSRDFNSNAQLTLEFMSSNLVAKAQKIAWEEFPDDRPGRIVAAISERCRLAVANEETISENRKLAHSVNRGMRV